MSNNRVQFGNATTPVVAPIVAWIPLGYSRIVVGAAAAGLGSGTISIPVDAVMALIQVESVAIRWRDDGTPPTASLGMLLAPIQEFQYSVANGNSPNSGFSAMQMISSTGANANVNVTFYK